MNTLIRLILISFIVSVLIFILLFRKSPMHALAHVNNITEAVNLFPTSVSEITKGTDIHIADAKKQVDAIIAIPDQERTFKNTAKALDDLAAMSDLVIFVSTLSSVESLYPDDAMRNAAHEKVLEIQNFFIDSISNNMALYEAFKAYAQGNALSEQLTDEQKYFVQETLQDFERAGLNLPQEKREAVKKLKKELAALELEFDKNIAQDKTTIHVQDSQLGGLEADFIASLKKTEDGLYILGVDYPTYFNVMENCTNSDTRQKMYEAFANRAYPINKPVLENIIAKRAELAHLLGFSSYAALDLDNQMVKTPARAEKFLDELIKKSESKATQEGKEFISVLPDLVPLTADNKFYPWDVTYLKNNYKKNKFNVDEIKVSEYFPMEKTIEGLLKIYEQFFNLEFKKLPAQKTWDPQVQAVEVIDKNNNTVVGYLFLDLFPRPNKYSHAAHHTVIHATYNEDGTPNKGVSVVMANFPKPTGNKPSLLKLNDVNTFFHEFGHALHALLGRTQIASFSGTNTKLDFVELPSQMLEEWLWDKEILTMVSAHYQTGQPLPDSLIDSILQLRTYDAGLWIKRQLLYAKLSLGYFNNGAQVDLDAFMKNLYQAIMTHVIFDARNHDYASFGHLTGYGARYYGYLWSKVFALDLFNEIKKEGLLNPVVGRRYVDTVIGKGGSQDPNQLLRNFLGREPNDTAFLKYMGL